MYYIIQVQLGFQTAHSTTNAGRQFHNEGLLGFAFAKQNTATRSFAAKQMRTKISADHSAASE
jgi:hypothetical protein